MSFHTRYLIRKSYRRPIRTAEIRSFYMINLHPTTCLCKAITTHLNTPHSRSKHIIGGISIRGITSWSHNSSPTRSSHRKPRKCSAKRQLSHTRTLSPAKYTGTAHRHTTSLHTKSLHIQPGSFIRAASPNISNRHGAMHPNPHFRHLPHAHMSHAYSSLPHGGSLLGNTRDSSYGRVPHRGSHEQFTLKTYVSVFLVIFFALEFCMYGWWKIARIRFSSSSLTIRKYIQTLVKRTRLPFPVPLFDGPSWWCEVISSKRRRKASAKGICIHVSRNVLFRQFVASCLVFAGVILSLLRLGHLANQSA